jgi:uncharacterized membrane protein
MKRPNVNIKLTVADWISETFSFLFVLAIIVLTATSYSSLPETIPTHLNASGTADGSGGKWSILLLASVGIAVYGLTTLAVRFPMLMNYPVTITPENHGQQYLNAVKLMRAVKLIVTGMLLYLIHMVIQNARGNSEGLGWLFLPISLLLVLGSAGYYLYRGYSIK